MRVAVRGCGLSGMATALFLQQHGIKVDIYEAMDRIADFPTRAEVFLSVYTKPINNLPRFIERKYGLGLNYHAPLNRIVWHTANASATAVGKLGAITLRGRDKNSLDRQLGDELSSKVRFGVSRTVDDLAEYEWVVDAAGQSDIQRYGSRSICFRGGTIRGRFSPNTMHIWHTSAATPKGFAYLLTQSSNTANVFLVIPLLRCNSSDQYFTCLWSLLRRDLGFEPDLISSEEFRRVLSDRLPGKANGVAQVGNSLGTSIPFLGIDQLFALSTSFSAVREILGMPGFPERIALSSHLNTMRTIRQAMETWGDLIFDNLVRMMRFGATPFFISKRNLLAATSLMLKPYVSMTGRGT